MKPGGLLWAVLAALVALALAAWLELARTRGAAAPAEGPGWAVLDSEQQLLRLEPDEAGFALTPERLLRLEGGAKTELLRTLELEVRPGERQSSYVDLRLPGKGREHRLYVVPGSPLTAYAGVRRPGEEWRELAKAELARSAQPRAPFVLALTLARGSLTLTCDGERLFALEGAEFEPVARAWLWTDDAHVARFASSVEDSGGARTSFEEDFAGAHRARLTGARLGGAARAALLTLLLAFLYAATRRARASALPQVLAAALALLAPVALPLAFAAFGPALPGAITGILCAACAVPGLRLAFALLGAGAPPTKAWRTGAWLCTALLFAGFAGSAARFAGDRARTQRAELEGARALAGERAPPLSIERALTLDLGNACELPGVRRDLRLAAHVTLEPGALLELRLRSPARRGATGVALFLGDVGRYGAQFVREENQDFVPIGEGCARVPVGRAFELSVEARGELFTAAIDGAEVARARCRAFPAGTGMLLAAAGTVRVEGLALETLAEAEELADPRRAALLAAALALAAGLALTLAAHLFLRQPLWHASASSAFVWVPGSVLLAACEPSTAPATLSVALASAAAGLLLLLHLLTLESVRPWRAALFVGTGSALLWMLARALGSGLSAPSTETWQPHAFPGPRLSPGLVALEHPLLRRYNDWLREHRLRGRAFALAKPPGTLRVLFTGSSSTFGHGIPAESGQDYPTLTGELLRARLHGLALEALNGGVPGSNSARLLPFFREALLAYQPDVVTLSIGFNDAHQLTVLDEGAYLARITQDDYEHDAHARRDGAALVRAGEARLKEVLTAFAQSGPPTAPLWQALAPPPGERSPPERYAENLRAFARLCAERGVRLVLVKEPVRDDGPLLWKEEFRAAIDAVAAEFGLAVLDPTPALLAAGPGHSLFMDEVHPTPAGHALLAREFAAALAPILAELAARAGASDGR